MIQMKILIDYTKITRKALAILTLITATTATFAQEHADDDKIMIGIRAGHNASFGSFSAFSLETEQNFDSNLQLSGGIQYNTIGRTALEARPAYTVKFDWGNISAETLFIYRNQTSVNSFVTGAGAGISSKWINVKAGYYYHIYRHAGESIKEPFNIFYEMSVNLLATVDSWNLQLRITNSERFELERHYQPSFIAQCSHDLNDSLSLSMGIGCKPAGMFHLSADYYQSFLNLGICYKW